MGQVVVAGRREGHRHGLGAPVLPEPAVDSGERRRKRSRRTAHRVHHFIGLRIASRSAIGLGVKLHVDGTTRLPRVQERLALVEAILVLQPLARRRRELHGFLLERALLRRDDRGLSRAGCRGLVQRVDLLSDDAQIEQAATRADPKGIDGELCRQHEQDEHQPRHQQRRSGRDREALPRFGRLLPIERRCHRHDVARK